MNIQGIRDLQLARVAAHNWKCPRCGGYLEKFVAEDKADRRYEGARCSKCPRARKKFQYFIFLGTRKAKPEAAGKTINESETKSVN